MRRIGQCRGQGGGWLPHVCITCRVTIECLQIITKVGFNNTISTHGWINGRIIHTSMTWVASPSPQDVFKLPLNLRRLTIKSSEFWIDEVQHNVYTMCSVRCHQRQWSGPAGGFWRGGSVGCARRIPGTIFKSIGHRWSNQLFCVFFFADMKELCLKRNKMPLKHIYH